MLVRKEIYLKAIETLIEVEGRAQLQKKRDDHIVSALLDAHVREAAPRNRPVRFGESGLRHAHEEAFAFDVRAIVV